MNELINTNDDRNTIHWKLLTGASALALAVSSVNAFADDKDHATLWIELGGQLERVNGGRDILTPPFFANAQPSVLAPMVDAQLPSRYTFGGEGKLSFTPQGSDWVFSAAIRYGRSNAGRHKHHETSHPTVPNTFYGQLVSAPFTHFNQFGDGQSNLRSSHTVLDFQAGKDVGLGLFGDRSSSVVSLGVRFAQFTSSMHAVLHARPVYASLPAFGSPGKYTIHSRYLTNNTAVIQSRRDTHAVGPSISWNASVPIAGNDASTSIDLDWGVNASLLFGCQRARVRHQTSGTYFKGPFAGAYGGYYKVNSYAHGPYDRDRSRNVTIPNVGGFAGVSVKFRNAKVSVGYRADYFFGAMDTGIDARKSSTIGFHGPFASISVGIGD